MTTTQTTNVSADRAPVPGLDDDEVGARIVAEELKLLETVNHALDAAGAANIDALRARETDEARMLELRDDVAVAKPEDLPALFEQMHTIGALRAQRGKGVVGTIDRASPYFGHLRLEEAGKRRDVLIGSKSYVDSAAGVRIVDWRHAPVSRIYYRYGQGEDYEEPMGGRIVEGTVVARRGVALVGGRLVRVTAPEGTYVLGADGTWRRAEPHAARLRTEKKEERSAAAAAATGSKHLPAIASMLDPAQFDLITRPGTGLVAVQGSAGSGKTTVGLHRVAYLAFADPQRFKPERMMVVVPHEALVNYVGRVLPELGVEGVELTTFGRFSRRVLTALIPKLPTLLSDETPPVVSRAKSSAAMLRAVHRAAERLSASMDARVGHAMAKWPSGEKAVAAWQATTGTVEQRVTGFAQWLKKESGALPDVTRGAIENLGHELRRQSHAVLATWDEICTSREGLGETFAKEPGFGPGQLDIVHDWCVRQARIRAEGERDGDYATIDAEDVPMLLRLWQVLRGPLPRPDGSPLRYTHLFVDEVQDHSPVELRVLLDLTTKDRSITLAGDTAQRMLDDDDARGELDWKTLLGELGLPTATLEPLKVSYRSTAEITNFARSVLGPYAHDEEPVTTRHGPPVELFSFASMGEAVAFIADALKQLGREEPYANVALVARFPQQADIVFEGLVRAEAPRVRRVAEQDFTWEPGFDVTDVRQTKGLEFDEVILLETTATSYPDSAPARHAMYVGATRAAHQLWCVASEKPSPLVTTALATT